MSATPRPWQPGVAGSANVVHFDGDDIKPVAQFVRPDDNAWACRAVNAFAALLAVAKAGEGVDENPKEYDRIKALRDALDALEMRHPDWREWTA